MSQKRAFISFDFDHDEELRDDLVNQSRKAESRFNIVDMSVRYSIDEAWKREVRERIQRSDLAIVICGRHTHDAKGVEIELTIIHEEKKPYFLLKGRRNATCTKPKQARRGDKINKWSWDNLQKLIAESGAS